MASQALPDGGGQLVEHRAVEDERDRVEPPRPVRGGPAAALPGAARRSWTRWPARDAAMTRSASVWRRLRADAVVEEPVEQLLGQHHDATRAARDGRPCRP